MNSHKRKRTKLKIQAFFFGRKKYKKKKNKMELISIHSHRGIHNCKTVYPDNWKPMKEFKCSDGTVILYNSIENVKATDEALKELGKDTIKGETTALQNEENH